jgi:hypothetical protein
MGSGHGDLGRAAMIGTSPECRESVPMAESHNVARVGWGLYSQRPFS